MKYDPDIHHRRSIRLKEYDYASAGMYFVTVCIHGRECLFGEVAGSVMHLNPAGEMVRCGWQGLENRFPNMILDEFTIMPNHFHGIIIIFDVGAPLAAPGVSQNVGALLAAPAFESDAIDKNATNQGAASAKPGAASSAPTLGSIMRVFKSISAIAVNRLLDRQERPLWQRNYYERVIRDERELDVARRYIVEHPIKWDLDKENPVNTPRPTDILSP